MGRVSVVVVFVLGDLESVVGKGGLSWEGREGGG